MFNFEYLSIPNLMNQMYIYLERRRAENADNAHERALEMMMAGRLETNIEEELKEEIEEPEFMVKLPEEWSEEEQKLAKEYEKKKTLVSAVFTLKKNQLKLKFCNRISYNNEEYHPYPPPPLPPTHALMYLYTPCICLFTYRWLINKRC